ncbi:HAD-IA family hydrolase [Oscillatoria laete-virens NRMC-F 0139]|nr:HAD-IA family hydrolase [Oscillatoria laete-virens]MDL5055241.1 HAD-IA family hydrolase [Oscillatoria laete-virens NRMC-F 0139]
MTASIKGIIFDMDGVLCDSEWFIQEAATRMFARTYGVTVTHADFIPFVGTGENRFIGGVAEKYGVSLDIDRDKAETYRLYLELIQGKLLPLPGVIDFISDCRRGGLKLAVATSADDIKMRGNLRQIGIPAESFDAIVTGSQVEKKKPDPEIFLTAAARMGLPNAHALVFEDAISGLAAAKAAGSPAVGVTTTHDDATLRAAGASWTLPDMTVIPPSLSKLLFGENAKTA